MLAKSIGFIPSWYHRKVFDLCVVGLGKIGLPIASYFLGTNLRVCGFDVDPKKIDSIQKGAPFLVNEPGLLDSEFFSQFFCSTDPRETVAVSSTVLIAVPLGLDNKAAPDFRFLDSAVSTVGENMPNDTLVLVETTLPVGTSRERIIPALERASGKRCEDDFLYAFSPERVSSGSIKEDLETYPKLVGPYGKKSAAKALEFYSRINFDEPKQNVWIMKTPETAEMTKLAETTYRDHNIAYANALAAECRAQGIDFDEVRNAANSQPYSHIHNPGLGVGGHCIPVYPHLLLSGAKSPEAFEVVRKSRDFNVSVTGLVLDEFFSKESIESGAKVCIVGACYRPGVPELANSAVFSIANWLRERGFKDVGVYDELISDGDLSNAGLKPFVGERPEVVIVNGVWDVNQIRNLLSGATHILDGSNQLSQGRDFPNAKLFSTNLGWPDS